MKNIEGIRCTYDSCYGIDSHSTYGVEVNANYKGYHRKADIS